MDLVWIHSLHDCGSQAWAWLCGAWVIRLFISITNTSVLQLDATFPGFIQSWLAWFGFGVSRVHHYQSKLCVYLGKTVLINNVWSRVYNTNGMHLGWQFFKDTYLFTYQTPITMLLSFLTAKVFWSCLTL